VIVDQLYGENLNFCIIERYRNLLEGNGCSVRVLGGERVTLSLFYEADWGADITILRMHFGVFDVRTWLFTHEEYNSSKHVLEQLSGEAYIGRCGSVQHPVFSLVFYPVDNDGFRIGGEQIFFSGRVVFVLCSPVLCTRLSQLF
jgi:hypothetical protein